MENPLREDGHPLDPHPSDAALSLKATVKPKSGTTPSDFELMSAMMQRLTLLEQKVQSQEREIECKNKQISVLQEKLRVKENSEENCIGDLERKCQQLQDQVTEMEIFLNDYGLIWVGDGNANTKTLGYQQTHSSVAGSSGDRGFQMNFDLVLRRIRELNILAGEETFVQSTATGAQLAKKNPIRLRLYSNGIMMFDGPFRSYEEQSTQQCMQDVMEGYFPSELQQNFPDGVPFEVEDRRNEEFIVKPLQDKFPGEGQAVHEKRHEPSEPTSSQMPDFSYIKLHMDQFLDRLPKVVVKAGQVIDVRDSVRATMQTSSNAIGINSAIVVETPAQQATNRLLAFTCDESLSARQVITLKVKSEDGNQTYILKMYLWETIGHLREHLDGHRGCSLPGYDIMSAYPRHCYNECQTLESCGIKTNATLLLQRRQQNDSLTNPPK